jgi:regulator of replication initiation timing
MATAEILQKIKSLNIDSYDSPGKQEIENYPVLLQIIETLLEENEKLKAENQKLRDEINRSKGEQGKPKIPSSKKKQPQDLSSEKERKRLEPPKKKKSKEKLSKIQIDRTEVCKVDPSILPPDAEFKGYETVVVQGINLKTDNVEFKKEVYYSPSQKETFMAKLPPGFEGEFSPELKSLILTLKHSSNMSESKIHEFLESIGIYISPATISRILTKNNDVFHQEKADIVRAGLNSTEYQQIDDTGTRVNGYNFYVVILCNLYYTAYFTVAHKNRLSIIEILQGGKPIMYYFNEEAFALLECFYFSKKMIEKLRTVAFGKVLDEEQMQQLLENIFPDPRKGKNQRTRIREAAAIAAYHDQTDYPVVSILLSDDAPQFKRIALVQALCWVHDARNYKKLNPFIPINQEVLKTFMGKYWEFYGKLLDFKDNPTQQIAEKLSDDFDDLFSTKTGYLALDERIEKTKNKKTELLMVLECPPLPLHNNDAELGAREQVRKRDVSLHTMTQDGTDANDTFLTIVQTAKKLGVSIYEYIHDRVSKTYQMTSLAEIITQKSLGPVHCDED